MSTNLPNELEKLRQTDPAVTAVMEAFAAADRIFQGALKAMGKVADGESSVQNSAEVTLSVGPSMSTAIEITAPENE